MSKRECHAGYCPSRQYHDADPWTCRFRLRRHKPMTGSDRRQCAPPFQTPAKILIMMKTIARAPARSAALWSAPLVAETLNGLRTVDECGSITGNADRLAHCSTRCSRSTKGRTVRTGTRQATRQRRASRWQSTSPCHKGRWPNRCAKDALFDLSHGGRPVLQHQSGIAPPTTRHGTLCPPKCDGSGNPPRIIVHNRRTPR